MTTALPTDSPNAFGPLVSRGDVARALIAQLLSPTTGLVFYVAERERRRSLPARSIPIPIPPMFRGGVDFETWGGDELPTVIVVVQGDGEPERHAGGDYEQTFRVQVGGIVSHDSELEATDLADEYGICMAACLLQNPALAGLAISVRLDGYPRTDFPSADRRNIARAIVTLQVFVEPVLGERYGPWPAAPPGPNPDPYAPQADYPLVDEVGLVLEADSLDGSFSETDPRRIIDHG